MKKIILMFVTAMMLVVNTYGNVYSAKDKALENANIEKINVNVSALIRVIQADSVSVNVISNDKYVRNNITYSIKNGILTIGTKQDVDVEDNNLRIIITTPNNDPEIVAGRYYKINNRKI